MKNFLTLAIVFLLYGMPLAAQIAPSAYAKAELAKFVDGVEELAVQGGDLSEASLRDLEKDYEYLTRKVSMYKLEYPASDEREIANLQERYMTAFNQLDGGLYNQLDMLEDFLMSVESSMYRENEISWEEVENRYQILMSEVRVNAQDAGEKVQQRIEQYERRFELIESRVEQTARG